MRFCRCGTTGAQTRVWVLATEIARHRACIGPGGCGEWEIADLEVVDAVVDAIPQPHRTAISFLARNLSCRAQVWSSPRLPAKRDELQVLLMEARSMLTRGLIAKGVI